MRSALFVFALGMFLTSAARAQPFVFRNYDRVTASQEATHLHEQQRLFRVAWQVSLNEDMLLRLRPWTAPFYFAEPGTFLPPNFFGYPLAEPPINQPVGQVEYQIGKNRTLSRPVYADEQVILQKTRGVTRGATGPREF